MPWKSAPSKRNSIFFLLFSFWRKKELNLKDKAYISSTFFFIGQVNLLQIRHLQEPALVSYIYAALISYQAAGTKSPAQLPPTVANVLNYILIEIKPLRSLKTLAPIGFLLFIPFFSFLVFVFISFSSSRKKMGNNRIIYFIWKTTMISEGKSNKPQNTGEYLHPVARHEFCALCSWCHVREIFEWVLIKCWIFTEGRFGSKSKMSWNF